MAGQQLNRVFQTLLVLLTVPGVVAAAPGGISVLSDLTVDEPVSGDVVVFVADLELGPRSQIEGDAIAIGGNVTLAPGAEVGRHVVAVFGEVKSPPGAVVGGRVLSFSSLSSLAPRVGTVSRTPRLDFALRLLTSGVWLLITTVLAFFLPTRMRHGVWMVPVLGMKVPLLGVMVGLTLVAALVAVLGLSPSLGVPMAAAVMVVFSLGKAVGLTVLSGWAGSTLLHRWLHHPLPLTLEVFVGMLVVLALRFLPVVGGTVWVLISFASLGICVPVLALTSAEVRPEAS